MSDPLYITVGTGAAPSAAFTLERPQFPTVIAVPSLTASDVRWQFATTSGGAFADLARSDGSALPFSVHSGTGPAIGLLERMPTPWGRLNVVASQTAVRTFTLLSTRYGT